MGALSIVFIILMVVAPYGMLFVKEFNVRIRLLFTSMASIAIFCLLAVAVFVGWDSLDLVMLTYGFCMGSIVILNLNIILVSWLASLSAK